MHYLAIETADTLSRVLRDGCPDPDRVAEVVCELDRYRRTVSEGARSRLTLFGDVASTLIANGNPGAATTIESQWNRLTRRLPFLTLCGYSASCLHDCAPEIWSKAFLEHSAVSLATDR
jgi:hypothetical protein